MDRIRLKQAITSGTWFECHSKWRDEELHFRLRCLAFEKTSVEEINPSQVDDVTIEGVLWLLSVEVVSLNKTPTEAWKIRNASKLIDEDGFEFEDFDSNLDLDRRSGLRRFSGWSDNDLSPKVRARGAIPFVLPDEEIGYYYALKDGDIKEA